MKMIQIDMPMPTNCLDCPACNEYLMCAIPVNGRKWGENDVREFGQGRPEWCPMKKPEAVEPKKTAYQRVDHTIAYRYRCGTCDMSIFPSYKYCPFCGQAVKWE